MKGAEQADVINDIDMLLFTSTLDSLMIFPVYARIKFNILSSGIRFIVFFPVVV